MFLVVVFSSTQWVHTPQELSGRTASSVPQEVTSEEQVRRMVDMCIAFVNQKGLFTIENPKQSLMFDSHNMIRLYQHTSVFVADLDQCAYGLALPGGPAHTFCKKSTRIVANFGDIRTVARICPGLSCTHKHEHAIGTRRVIVDGKAVTMSMAKAAGRYPSSLCHAIAVAVRAALVSQRLM